MGLTKLLVPLLLVSAALAFCPDGCGCDEEKLAVVCIRSDLQVMPISLNPSIKTLILKYNNFKTVDASFNFYSSLEHVDLSNNEILAIPDRSFQLQRQLLDLRMRDNKLSQLRPASFKGLSRLESLDLRGNLLEALQDEVFTSLRSLKQLDVGGNRITKLDGKVFKGLDMLVVLYLDDNSLASVPSEALKYLPNLAELNMAGNRIKVVDDQALARVPSLSLLDLSHNQMEAVGSEAFVGLGSLKTLKIHDNLLTSVPTKSFSPITSLEFLKVGQNQFASIGQDAFGPLSRLAAIDITGCPDLKSVERGAFASNINLQSVRLSSNRRLARIEPENFSQLSSLVSVDLSYNSLAALPPDLLPWERLASLTLTGNPWLCDCTSVPLQETLVAMVRNNQSVATVKCWSPPAYRDKDLVWLEFPECAASHSPSRGPSPASGPPTPMIAGVSAGLAVLVIVLAVGMLHCRKKYQDHGEVAAKEVLYYPEKEIPRILRHPAAMPRHWEPAADGGGRTDYLSDPATCRDSFVRHDHYFLTLAKQEKNIYEAPVSEI